MIICLEGINGAGKSTLSAVLGTAWEEMTGHGWRLVDLTQSTDLGRKVRSAIMASPDCGSAAEDLAFAAARLSGYQALVADGQAHAADGPLYIVERWAGGVWAYGNVMESEPAHITFLEELLWRHWAAPTVLLDISGAEAHDRLQTMTGLNKFETRGSDYLDAVASCYRRWASRRDAMVLSQSPRPGEVTEVLNALIAKGTP